MNETVPLPDRIVEVLLAGGPTDLPAAARRLHADAGENRIKMLHCGGYEHFERVDGQDTADGCPVIYRWVARTRIAE
jgi:Family of unknown function (DUF5988)